MQRLLDQLSIVEWFGCSVVLWFGGLVVLCFGDFVGELKEQDSEAAQRWKWILNLPHTADIFVWPLCRRKQR